MTPADDLESWESVREAFLTGRARISIRGTCKGCGETHLIAPDYDPDLDAFRTVCPACGFLKVMRCWCGPDGKEEEEVVG